MNLFKKPTTETASADPASPTSEIPKLKVTWISERGVYLAAGLKLTESQVLRLLKASVGEATPLELAMLDVEKLDWRKLEV